MSWRSNNGQCLAVVYWWTPCCNQARKDLGQSKDILTWSPLYYVWVMLVASNSDFQKFKAVEEEVHLGHWPLRFCLCWMPTSHFFLLLAPWCKFTVAQLKLLVSSWKVPKSKVQNFVEWTTNVHNIERLSQRLLPTQMPVYCWQMPVYWWHAAECKVLTICLVAQARWSFAKDWF